MKVEEHWKEWASICRVYNKKDTFPITLPQLFDFAESYHKKQMGTSNVVALCGCAEPKYVFNEAQQVLKCCGCDFSSKIGNHT
jgi:hypothetical protein